MSRFRQINQHIFNLTVFKPLKKSLILTAVDPAWFYLLLKEEVFSSFSIFASLASTLMAAMTATLLTTRWRWYEGITEASWGL